MRDEISEQSKMYASKTITAEEVYKMCDNDIALEHIDNFIGDKVLVLTDDLYIFICANKDLTDRGVNVILEDSLKLFLRIHTHRGTWYDDNYTPYCGQGEVKCSGPRMIRTDYGNKCPECKNEIGLSGLRLTDSPLNDALRIKDAVGFKDISDGFGSLGVGNRMPEELRIKQAIGRGNRQTGSSGVTSAQAAQEHLAKNGTYGTEPIGANFIRDKNKDEFENLSLKGVDKVVRPMTLDELKSNPEIIDLVKKLGIDMDNVGIFDTKKKFKQTIYIPPSDGSIDETLKILPTISDDLPVKIVTAGLYGTTGTPGKFIADDIGMEGKLNMIINDSKPTSSYPQMIHYDPEVAANVTKLGQENIIKIGEIIDINDPSVDEEGTKELNENGSIIFTMDQNKIIDEVTNVANVVAKSIDTPDLKVVDFNEKDLEHIVTDFPIVNANNLAKSVDKEIVEKIYPNEFAKNSEVVKPMTFGGGMFEAEPKMMKQFDDKTPIIASTPTGSNEEFKKIWEQSAKENDPWIKLETFLSKPGLEHVKTFRIDTRDFATVDNSEHKKFEEKFTPHLGTIVRKYPNRFDYNLQEIINVLRNAKITSGGEKEWRMLHYKQDKGTMGWELKYLQIIKIADNKYVILNSEDNLLRKSMWSGEHDPELL